MTPEESAEKQNNHPQNRILWGGALCISILCLAGWLLGVGTGDLNEFGMRNVILMLNLIRTLVWPIGVVVAILIASASVGMRVLKTVRVQPQRPTIHLLFATGTGLGLFTTVTLVIGSTLSLKPWLHWSLLVGFLVSGWTCLRPVLKRAWDDVVQWIKDRSIGELSLGGMFVAFVVLGVFCAGKPVFDYDTLEYHLGAPGEYYQQGQISYLAHNVYASFPEHVETLYLSGIVLSNSKEIGQNIAILIQVLFGVLSALAVGALAKEIGGDRAFIPAALIFVSCPMFIGTILRVHIIMARCFYLALALLALVYWIQSLPHNSHDENGGTLTAKQESEGPGFSWIVLCGISCGLAAAVKYPAFLFVCIPFGIFVLIAGIVRNRGGWPQIRPVLLLTAAATVSVSPWLIKNLSFTGNPFFPLLYDVFGGRGWPAHQAAKFAQAHSVSIPGSVSKYLRDIWGFILGFSSHSKPVFSNPLVIAGIPFLGAGLFGAKLKGKRWMSFFIGGYGLVYIILWTVGTHRIDRFLAPVVIPFTILSAAGYAYILRFEKARKVTIAALFALSACMLWNQAVPAEASKGLGGTLTGDTLTDLMTSPEAEVGRAYAQAVKWINSEQNTTPGSRVMLVGEARVYPFNRPVKYSVVFNDHPIQPALRSMDDSINEAVAELRKTGIQYVLVNWSEIRRLSHTYRYHYQGYPRRGFLPELNWATRQPLDSLLRAAGTRVAHFGRINWPVSGSAQRIPVIEIYRIRNSRPAFPMQSPWPYLP